MARPGSVAIGGYFKTPDHLVPRIAALLEPLNEKTQGEESFMDPCAGEGDAILGLVKALGGSHSIYTCEMEATRAATTRDKLQAISWGATKNLVVGDAFCVSFKREKKDGISVLFLNPPYDLDRVHGRLEHKFLARFTDALMPDGILLFVVPHYALKASAEFIGREFSDARAFRFPGNDFDTFKQVVFVGRKSPALFEADPSVVAQVNAWAQDASELPELPEVGATPFYKIPLASSYRGGLDEWKHVPLDLTALKAKFKPWHQTTRGGQLVPIQGILPDVPVHELLLRTYPVATPPRPAHIAAGIASGIFNGARIEPSDQATKLPPLLVKGVFDREYRTIEEKVNKDGEIKAVVQVQQPKLVTTVLDLRTHQYHVLASGNAETGTPNVSNMTVADLLKHYGPSLMQTMERQCPIFYDPRRDAESITLAPSPRKLFTAQSHAVKAIVKLLGGTGATKRQRKGKAAILLGEIGSGKSTVALMVGRTLDMNRPLIMCPPHLLESWTNEIAAVCPDADVRVLSSVADLEAVARAPKERFVISILSRETAKLNHGWVSVGARCPKCDGETPSVDLAKKRSRCEHTELRAEDTLAELAVSYARQLARHAPQDPRVHQFLRGRQDRKLLAHFNKHHEDKRVPAFRGVERPFLEQVLETAIKLRGSEGQKKHAEAAIVLALFMLGDEAKIEETARVLLQDETPYSYDSFGRDLLNMLPPKGERQVRVVSEFRAKASSFYSPWASFLDSASRLTQPEMSSKVGEKNVSWSTGVLTVNGYLRGSVKTACALLAPLSNLGRFRWSKPCGEFLYQAVPEPRRVALADHICTYYPNLFDQLVLDEGHEYSGDGSAQERSAHRLTSLGIPTILQTGSIMNGYAESLFMNMWALSPKFRNEFGRDEKQRFIDRYGYRKRVLEDKEDGKVVEFGSQSDRVVRSERIVGNAPGVLPLFLLRHLLTLSVTLHKADLAIDLPPCIQERHMVDPGPELRKRYESLQRALVAQIKKDQFSPELAGKLFGQLAELPSYLDRATKDTGNCEEGHFEIRYPESVGAKLVALQPGLSSDELLPKESWMLDRVERELSEGRNVMVFTWHVNLLPRFARLISERIGETVPVLYADKVPTAKRQSWIEREIVKKGRRVLVVNPVAIQTGLNNLVHFASEIWMETPACNPIIFRQAIGRVDRIGQRLETRIMTPIYADTLQVQLYDLLMQKVAISTATDGLDPESALQAAGVGEDTYLAGLSIGKQLWAMLTERSSEHSQAKAARSLSGSAGRTAEAL